MRADYQAVVDAIGADAVSGATDIVLRAAGLLLDAAGKGADLPGIARACANAQPTMAGLLTLEAVVSEAAADPVPAVRRLMEQVRRAPAAIARHAAAVLMLVPEPRPQGRLALRVVTCSSSRAVEATLLEVARLADVVVCCAESRPRREGLAMAGRLAERGITVELFSDAGISSAVRGSDAVLVGADAIGSDFFVNKVGTAALCALGSALGVPAYALGGREKRLRPSDQNRLILADAPPGEVVEAQLPGVLVRNPYFERVPLALVTQIITDMGVQHPSDIYEW